MENVRPEKPATVEVGQRWKWPNAQEATVTKVFAGPCADDRHKDEPHVHFPEGGWNPIASMLDKKNLRSTYLGGPSPPAVAEAVDWSRYLLPRDLDPRECSGVLPGGVYAVAADGWANVWRVGADGHGVILAAKGAYAGKVGERVSGPGDAGPARRVLICRAGETPPPPEEVWARAYGPRTPTREAPKCEPWCGQEMACRNSPKCVTDLYCYCSVACRNADVARRAAPEPPRAEPALYEQTLDEARRQRRVASFAGPRFLASRQSHATAFGGVWGRAPGPCRCGLCPPCVARMRKRWPELDVDGELEDVR